MHRTVNFTGCILVTLDITKIKALRLSERVLALQLRPIRCMRSIKYDIVVVQAELPLSRCLLLKLDRPSLNLDKGLLSLWSLDVANEPALVFN